MVSIPSRCASAIALARPAWRSAASPGQNARVAAMRRKTLRARGASLKPASNASSRRGKASASSGVRIMVRVLTHDRDLRKHLDLFGMIDVDDRAIVFADEPAHPDRLALEQQRIEPRLPEE